MFKPTRVRYKNNNGILFSQKFLSKDLDFLTIRINPETKSIDLIKDNGEVLFGIVSSKRKLTDLKKQAKQLIVDAGVDFFEEARQRS
jgi:hypothetical protein